MKNKKCHSGKRHRYPPVANPGKVGRYDLLCKSGGGMLYRKVLEYRVWDHGTDGDDACCCFADYELAKQYSDSHEMAEPPLALVLQNPWITWNDVAHDYELVDKDRIAEWRVEWLDDDHSAANAGNIIARLRRENPNGWE